MNKVSNMMSVFKLFDRDNDGRITENDFVLITRQLGLKSIGESAARQAFRRADKNHNGKLDITELIGLVNILKGGGHPNGSHSGMGGKHGGGAAGLIGGILNAVSSHSNKTKVNSHQSYNEPNYSHRSSDQYPTPQYNPMNNSNNYPNNDFNQTGFNNQNQQFGFNDFQSNNNQFGNQMDFSANNSPYPNNFGFAGNDLNNSNQMQLSGSNNMPNNNYPYNINNANNGPSYGFNV